MLYFLIGYNKKFASNVQRLFNSFKPISYASDFSKEVRVYLIKKIAEIILKKDILEKEDILDFLDVDGKYGEESRIILDGLKIEDVTESELKALDELISDQLRYSAIERSGDEIIDLLNNLKTENFDSLESHMQKIETSIEKINKDIKDARESIEDSKKDISLSSSNFISFIDKVIEEEKNPASRIKTGIRYLNDMLGGGFQKGQN